MARVAITTAWDGNPAVSRGYRCAIPRFCQDAGRLGRLLRASTPATSVDVLFLLPALDAAATAAASRAVESECPLMLTAVVRASDELMRAVAAFDANVDRRGTKTVGSSEGRRYWAPMFSKWWAASLEQCHAM